MPADHVFLATGMKPCGGLYEQLCAEGVKAYIVGDCQTPGKIYDAIHSGYQGRPQGITEKRGREK